MNESQLILIPYDTNGNVSGRFEVDLLDTVSLPITKSIVDVKEPEQRKADYTKTISIPGTQNNNAIFSNIFNLDRATINQTNINYQPDFNPNLNVDAILYQNGIVQIQGYLQLNQINITNGLITYEIVIIGKFANLFQAIQGKNIRDIDLSEFDHAWNRSNIEASWIAPVGSGYVYPLIDRGNSTNNQQRQYRLDTMYPAVYVKTIIDKIFSDAGYRYESNFFNSDRFKRLIIPYSGGLFNMTEQEVADRTFEAGISTMYSAPATGALFDNIVAPFDVIVKDTVPPGFNTSTYEFEITAGLEGKATFRAELDISLVNNTVSTMTESLGCAVTIQRRTALGVTNTYGYQFVLRPFSIPTLGSFDTTFSTQSPEIDVSVGDFVYVGIQFGVTNRTNGGDYTFNIKDTSSFFNAPNPSYQENQTISIVSALPDKIKQSDFVSSIFKMFNLYYDIDQIDKEKFIIEPREDFYTDSVFDLTDYLDLSKQIESRPMGLLDFRDFDMMYTEDDDYLNKTYQDVYLEPYGTNKFDVNNDFIKEEKQVKVIFSPTPNTSSTLVDRVGPQIVSPDPNTQPGETTYNIRILYWAGYQSTADGWEIIQNDGTKTSYSVWPYAGMVNDTINPTFSLEFGIPKALFYSRTVAGGAFITTANLFNTYWWRNILEITDKDSKLITAYFKLSPHLISLLSFRKLYKLDNQFYRLNKIEYDLSSREPVKIELLKTYTAPQFIPQQIQVNGGFGQTPSGENDGMTSSLPTVKDNQNGKFIGDRSNTYTDITGTSDSVYFVNWSQKIHFLDGTATAYLPDANTAKLDTGYPIIILKNINGGTVTVKSIISTQNIDSKASFDLKSNEAAWFAPYDGQWRKLYHHKEP